LDYLDYINTYIDNSIAVKQKLRSNELVLNKISTVAAIVVDAYKAGNKVLLAGNGGSAADAQHIAAEFVSRFFYDRPGLPAISLTTDTSMLTAIGNDYGYENLFARQLQAQSKPGDIFIGISTSGNSKNVVNAVKNAKALGVTTVIFCGEGGVLKDICDYAICVPSDCTPYIQECHICIGHIICAIVEAEIFPNENA
jgi:D-sedoheptulose 7-phosphate isomerase